MVPTVAQQLQAIRNTLAKTVVPAINPDESFAQEQAALILASLDWVLDVQASEHRYERVDHDDARALLEALIGLAGSAPELIEEARAALDEAATAPDDLLALRAQTLTLKQLGERAYAAAAATEHADRARDLLAASARRQSERELAWGRMTGFPRNVEGDIAVVLAGQSAESGQAARSVAGAST